MMTVAEFFSIAEDLKEPLTVLVDLAASTEKSLRVAKDCRSAWFSLDTADIKSMQIIDFVDCDDGNGYHKVLIVFKGSAASLIRSGSCEHAARTTATRSSSYNVGSLAGVLLGLDSTADADTKVFTFDDFAIKTSTGLVLLSFDHIRLTVARVPVSPSAFTVFESLSFNTISTGFRLTSGGSLHVLTQTTPNDDFNIGPPITDCTGQERPQTHNKNIAPELFDKITRPTLHIDPSRFARC
jgi:hypothetical protein